MARYFLDSSALVKRYHQEHGSTGVDALFAAADNRLFISRIAIVEIHSAFARLVRERVLAEADFARLIARLEEDVGTGILNVAAVSSRRLEGAATIFATHGMTHSIRTVDAIHLATAQALHRRGAVAGFVAADKKLLAVASAACGLTILDVT
ncbi:MAG: type II toxin-antitoxin system VapC family toxin [Planctomycetia bacterium]|nr:type II toxin-antitoxin system VapC family toxin [Planctomycetia bacterium]